MTLKSSLSKEGLVMILRTGYAKTHYKLSACSKDLPLNLNSAVTAPVFSSKLLKVKLQKTPSLMANCYRILSYSLMKATFKRHKRLFDRSNRSFEWKFTSF